MNKLAKLLVISSLFVISLPVLAQSKGDITAALDALQKTGRFTKAQIEAAKRQLGTMDHSEIQNLAEIGQRKLASDPNFHRDVYSVKPKNK